ncbi:MULTISPECIES: DUF3397 domain-containing protein [Solibacillus]|uniref:DUF3397 domain-containing protein n=1 Tax=Solibacillus faecavium TaxID=2762221 RepID=A0ABR8XUE2_9BACL|nr:DUF3397 domain-containing protein [Solibacillus faecavium]MBD8035537.1 DUF3397 domain-containing protein [Solibacillus faecavium]
MIVFLQFAFATIILCPIIAFIAVMAVCRKLRIKKNRTIGLAADITTFLLFFSIPIAMRGLWDIGVMMPMLIIVLVIAIIFTYIDWRTKKEIEIKPLLRKIWRIYFLLFSFSYFLIWIVGITHSVMVFMMID